MIKKGIKLFFVLSIAVFINFLWFSKWMSAILSQKNLDWYDFFKDQGAIIGGVLALIAAVSTISTIKEQIKQVERHFNFRNEARRRAMRSRLRISAAELCEYLRNSIKYFYPLDLSILRMRPNNPEKAIETFINSMEVVDEISSKKISDIIYHYQIFISVFDEYEDLSNAGKISKIPEMFFKSIKLYSMIENVFGYARFQEDYIPQWQLNVESSLHNLLTPQLVSDENEYYTDILNAAVSYQREQTF